MSSAVIQRPASSALRRRLALLAKLAVSLALLALVAGSIDVKTVGGLVLGLSPAGAAAAVASLAAIAVVSALRWQLVIGAIGPRQPFARILGLMFVGSFFTQMLPTSVGGDAVRIWQLSRYGVPAQRAFIGVMLERITGLIALVLMVAGGVVWLGEALSPPALGYVLLACLPILLVGLAVLCLLDRLPPGLQGLPLVGPGLRLLATMAADARRVLLAPRLSLVLLALSAVAQFCSILTFYALAGGLGLPLSLAAATAVVPGIILITFLPISFAGWGVREGASIAMLAAVGLGADQAVALSVLFGLASILAGLPGLPLWLAHAR
ncbi:lysylphosphatidylglycerol synthase transmembrane domain-containing protein [Pelagibius sp.]|uniref:lysylphosphatidylglycerol synthase transmembrane domain-containing protein n=1 Tax=Pelagibius sp. TaxID=1931238 RepID=UPI003B50E906